MITQYASGEGQIDLNVERRGELCPRFVDTTLFLSRFVVSEREKILDPDRGEHPRKSFYTRAEVLKRWRSAPSRDRCYWGALSVQPVDSRLREARAADSAKVFFATRCERANSSRLRVVLVTHHGSAALFCPISDACGRQNGPLPRHASVGHTRSSIRPWRKSLKMYHCVFLRKYFCCAPPNHPLDAPAPPSCRTLRKSSSPQAMKHTTEFLDPRQCRVCSAQPRGFYPKYDGVAKILRTHTAVSALRELTRKQVVLVSVYPLQ